METEGGNREEGMKNKMVKKVTKYYAKRDELKIWR